MGRLPGLPPAPKKKAAGHRTGSLSLQQMCVRNDYWQFPFTHCWLMHSMHWNPPLPHAVLESPETQTPPAVQQPLGQLVGAQFPDDLVQELAWQMYPEPCAVQS